MSTFIGGRLVWSWYCSNLETPCHADRIPSRRFTSRHWTTIFVECSGRSAGFMGVEPDLSSSTSVGNVAFRRYVVPELPVLLRVARRITGDVTDAEDLVQETLIRAYRAVDRFDGRYPRAWLLTILRNTWRNMNRKARPHLLDTADDMLSVPATGADGRSGAEEHVVDGMLDAELVAGLRSLSDNHRAVVTLVDIDGLTYQEAADVLGVPVGTVMSRLHRARKRLRTRLEQRGYQLAVHR
jgi:RNA polymerase sigma-70 factor (ECF subfamily)